jgi:hypothetical protein
VKNGGFFFTCSQQSARSEETSCKLEQSMYIRVKRRKQTFFLHVEPTDTILEVKSKLQELLEQVWVPCMIMRSGLRLI